MDPLAAHNEYELCMMNGRWEDAIEAAENLVTWFRKGGFMPSNYWQEMGTKKATAHARFLLDLALRSQIAGERILPPFIPKENPRCPQN